MIEGIVGYLQDNNISEREIVRVLEEDLPKDPKKVTFDVLPEWLWEESLLRPNTFYFHHKLHLPTERPKMDGDGKRITLIPFKMEMRIRFTLDDLLAYFYRRSNMPIDLRDEKRDRGALQALLRRYKNISFATAVDFVLLLIDWATYDEDIEISDVFSIEEVRFDANKDLESRRRQARLAKADKIRWRVIRCETSNSEDSETDISDEILSFPSIIRTIKKKDDS